MEATASPDVPGIAIFGAGSWGTALAVLLAEAGREVTLWGRRPEAVRQMQEGRRNPRYLPDVHFPDDLKVTGDLEETAQTHAMWLLATPSQSVRPLAQRLDPLLTDRHRVVSVAKGIENTTLMTTTQVLREVLSGSTYAQLGVLYGPSHAEEVAAGKPTTVVAASRHEQTAQAVQEAIMTPTLRVYVNLDLTGVEIAGSVKNILAIAAGISDGLGYGDNTKAAIVTRGVAEIKRLGLALGARASTFAGLAGIGDVVVTCMSRHSRNRYLGEQIGKGKRLADIEKDMSMIAEGVRTTESVRDLARRHGVEMPITEAVYATLFEGKAPIDAVEELMTREAKREGWPSHETAD